MSEYIPTEARLRDRVKGSLEEYAHEFGIDGEAAMDEWIDQALAERDAKVRADERANIEKERRREHAEASAQRVPPIVEMADGFVGSTKIDRLGIELMRVWGRVAKTSSVSQYPLSYVATFADMARAVLDWPELDEDRAKLQGRIEELEKNLSYEVEQKIKLADTLRDERAKRPDREQIARIQFEIDNVHQIHGETCLCGFKSSRSRSRTEHLTALFADAVLALEPETDQELQDRIEVLEKNLAYEVAQKIKLAEQLQAATATDLTLEQARWKMHAGIESRCSEEVAAEVKPVIDLVFSSLALKPEAREEPIADEWCRKESCRYRHWRSGSMPTHKRGSECPPPSAPEAREVTGQGYSNAHENTVEMLSDLLAEVGIVTPGNEQRLSKFASAIVQKVEARLPAREVTDAEVEAARVAYLDLDGPLSLTDALRVALRAAREVPRGS